MTPEERDRYILGVVECLLGDDLSTAGEHRLGRWEKGWEENLEAWKAERDPAVLVPHYHDGQTLVHWKQRIVRPLVPQFDFHVIALLVDWAVKTYLGTVDTLMEFGCGPAHHLLRARRYNPRAHLVGLDWATASQRIISEVVASGQGTNLSGHNFNLYEPDYALPFTANTGVLTVAALEQVGERFEPFLQFLLAKRPAVCVHFEPIDELLDGNSLIDRLTVLYCRKRNYLHGFLPRLRELEAAGQIVLRHVQRTYQGSHFIEGHSLVVWSPV